MIKNPCNFKLTNTPFAQISWGRFGVTLTLPPGTKNLLPFLQAHETSPPYVSIHFKGNTLFSRKETIIPITVTNPLSTWRTVSPVIKNIDQALDAEIRKLNTEDVRMAKVTVNQSASAHESMEELLGMNSGTIENTFGVTQTTKKARMAVDDYWGKVGDLKGEARKAKRPLRLIAFTHMVGAIWAAKKATQVFFDRSRKVSLHEWNMNKFPYRDSY